MFFRDERDFISEIDDNEVELATAATLGLNALQAIESGVVMVDLRQPDQPIVYANEGFCRVTGYTPEEVLGRNCRFLQGAGTDPKAVDAIRAAIESGRKTTVVLKNYRKNGSWFWNELHLVPFRQSGEVTHYTGIQNDVTDHIETTHDLHASQTRLRLLMSAGAEAVFGLDQDGVCTFCNPACVELLGYNNAGELVGRDMRDVLYGDGDAANVKALSLVSKVIREGTVSCSDQEIFRRRDGTQFPVELRLNPIMNGESIAGAVANFVDISERRETERALRQAQVQAEQSQRSKSEFLANMSHEIRTPMTAILGYADILSTHIDDPDNRECVEVIRRNGRFLLDIVDDILDLSRIESGNLQLDPVEFRLDELVSDLRSLMEVRAQEKGLPLVVEYEGEIPERMLTDPTRLRQILINLLSNAIKFTESGTIRLVIRYAGETGDRQQWYFDVIDTGIGIAPQQQRQIFRPFSQVDTSDTRQYEGSGLGLPISRRLASILGGNISLQSQVNRGSRFTLHLETYAIPGVGYVTPAHEITAPDYHDPVARRRLRGRVLVVDDRRDIRYLAQYFLEEAGAHVECAETGQRALEMVESQTRPFDLILMDVQMPVMDGLAATRALRKRGFQRPIIALTAGARSKDRRRSIKAGCDAHVTKPIDGVALVNLVSHYMCHNDSAKLATKGSGAPTESSNMTQTAKNKHRILIVDDSLDASEAMMKLFEILGHEVSSASDGLSGIATAESFVPDFVILDLGLPDIDGYEVATRLRKLAVTGNATIVALSGRDGDPDRLRTAGFDHHFLKPANLAEIKALLDGESEGPGIAGRRS